MRLSNWAIGTRLLASFAVVLLTALGLSLFARGKVNAVAGLTERLYRHPYTVTSAALEVQGHITAMHRSMKDVALARTGEGIAAAVADVDGHEKAALESFDLILERFLGEKKDIEAARRAFEEWRPIRDEVIALSREGKAEAAAQVTRERGAVHVTALNDQVAGIVTFAKEKAAAFMVTAQEERQQASTSIWVVMLGLLAACSALAWVATRSITRPMNTLKDAMASISGGELETTVPERDRGDEVGAMAAALEVFKQEALEKRRLEAERVVQEREKADREREAAERAHRVEDERKAAESVARRQALLDLATSFERSVLGLVDDVAASTEEMRATAASMSSLAGHTRSQSEMAKSAAEQTSGNVQEVSAAVEELSASVAEIRRRVEGAARVSVTAVDKAERSSATVQRLTESAHRIGEVVGLIATIAKQTNLLALNATIEAARAGEAGKGFAVVASEVKNLATQTAQATNDITAQIEEIQASTKEVVGAISDITGTITEIREISSGIATSVEQQGVATQEISRNAHGAAGGTGQVADTIAEVLQAAAETGDGASMVLTASANLADRARMLSQQVGEFLDNVRAA